LGVVGIMSWACHFWTLDFCYFSVLSGTVLLRWGKTASQQLYDLWTFNQHQHYWMTISTLFTTTVIN
jgi:hypothetical protein